MNTQKCKYCGKNKPTDDFEIANVINGKEYRRRKCRRCYQDTKNAHRRHLRLWLDELKRGKKCSCGEDDFRVLDFHHRDPDEKDLEVSMTLGRWGKERILKEIDKCDVICAKCHRILHWEEIHKHE